MKLAAFLILRFASLHLSSIWPTKLQRRVATNFSASFCISSEMSVYNMPDYGQIKKPLNFSDFIIVDSNLLKLIAKYLFAIWTYSHHWLSVTIHFNRYNLTSDKFTENGDKCKPLSFIALHIRLVPPSFSPFAKCPPSVSKHWPIEHFRMDVTERLWRQR